MASGSRSERPLRAAPAAITAPCQTCGRTPALTVTYRTVVGLVLPFRLATTRRRYCRACGSRAFKVANNRTLVAGWWSVFGFFVNIVVVVANLRAYRRVRALGSPRQAPHVSPQTVRPVR